VIINRVSWLYHREIRIKQSTHLYLITI